MLVWDSGNNALKAIKADGTSANFYATGGVSALGMSAGVSQVDSMTFNHLSVKNSMTLNGSVNIITGSQSQIIRSSGNSDCIYLLNYYEYSASIMSCIITISTTMLDCMALTTIMMRRGGLTPMAVPGSKGSIWTARAIFTSATGRSTTTTVQLHVK